LLVEYKDLGTMVEGKIESGIIRKGKSLPVPGICGINTDIVFLIVEKKYMMMPQKQLIHISALYGEQEDEIPLVRPYFMYGR
jgi:peptide chain release factor subunit 3